MGSGIKHFSNSLIIHEDKTKEITTVKEVWICDPNYHKIWWISLTIINALRSYFKHSKECFIRYPNTLDLVKKKKKLACTLFLQPTWQCLDIWWNSLHCVWYITWDNRQKWHFKDFRCWSGPSCSKGGQHYSLDKSLSPGQLNRS